MTQITTDMRVKAGEAWLDEHIPGWFDKINLEKLNMTSGYDCVLAQAVDASYLQGCTAHELSKDRAAALGFNAANIDSTTEYKDLQHEWIDRIAARQAASRAGEPDPAPTKPAALTYTLVLAHLAAPIENLTWEQVNALVQSMPDVELTILRAGL